MTQFHPDAAGRPCIDVTNKMDGSRITVYQQGAHLTSWRTSVEEEHLYTSPKAVYKDGKAIRGGVPLIFPQFSDLGPLPVSHGFLRVSSGWCVRESKQVGDEHMLVLEYNLKPGEEPSFAEGCCKLLYTIAFTAITLRLHMCIENTHESTPLTFAFAFHTYFAVADVTSVEIGGLDGTEYLDDLQDRKRCPAAPVRRITGEIDRIYLNQKDEPVTVRTTAKVDGKPKMLIIVGRGFNDVVLWNPWVEKTKGMSDMPEDGYKKFLCVEHGTIIEKEVLPPQGKWEATQVIYAS